MVGGGWSTPQPESWHSQSYAGRGQGQHEIVLVSERLDYQNRIAGMGKMLACIKSMRWRRKEVTSKRNLTIERWLSVHGDSQTQVHLRHGLQKD